jgi:hypothetical protein
MTYAATQRIEAFGQIVAPDKGLAIGPWSHASALSNSRPWRLLSLHLWSE